MAHVATNADDGTTTLFATEDVFGAMLCHMALQQQKLLRRTELPKAVMELMGFTHAYKTSPGATVCMSNNLVTEMYT